MSALILDDTPNIRTGRMIEYISFVHDYVDRNGKTGGKLGFKKLILEFHDCKSFLPVSYNFYYSEFFNNISISCAGIGLK